MGPGGAVHLLDTIAFAAMDKQISATDILHLRAHFPPYIHLAWSSNRILRARVPHGRNRNMSYSRRYESQALHFGITARRTPSSSQNGLLIVEDSGLSKP